LDEEEFDWYNPECENTYVIMHTTRKYNNINIINKNKIIYLDLCCFKNINNNIRVYKD
jgi:hypothetical protein